MRQVWFYDEDNKLIAAKMTEDSVDMCEYPTECDAPECGCPILWTTRSIAPLYAKIRELEEQLKPFLLL